MSLQSEASEEFDIDLDEVLDIEDDIQRKIFVRVSLNKRCKTNISSFSPQKILTDSKSSKEIINVSTCLKINQMKN